MRHQFALDLLRPGITVEEEVELMTRKSELTTEDLQTIRKNAMKVAKAATIMIETIN